MKAGAHTLFLVFTLVACSGSGKDDDTDETDVTDVTDLTESHTGSSDTWVTDTGGQCTGGGLCLCPDDTCGAEAGTGDCDRDFDGCICSVSNDSFGDCPTTGGSGGSGAGGSGADSGHTTGTTGTTTTTDPTGGTTSSTGSSGTGGTSEAKAPKGGMRSILDVFGY